MLGSLFAQDDTLILKDGQTHSIKYIETLPDGTVRVQMFNNGSILATSFDLNEVHILILEDGTIAIEPTENLDRKYHLSTNKLISSGKNLVEFRTRYYNGFIMVLVGQLAIVYGAVANENDALLGGYLFSFIGSIAQLLSFNYVGEAGEDLIDQGVELDKQTK